MKRNVTLSLDDAVLDGLAILAGDDCIPRSHVVAQLVTAELARREAATAHTHTPDPANG